MNDLFISSSSVTSALVKSTTITTSLSSGISGTLAPQDEWMAYGLALVIQLCLILYALSAGADFGGGILHLFTPRDERLRALWRELIDDAIAPIWESNHVWLIVAIVVLFVSFPVGFTWISVGLHLPLLLLLFGITLRGAAFVFTHYDPRGVSAGWRRVFSASSAFTPVSLGIIAGSIASGQLADQLHPFISASDPTRLDYARVDASLWWSTWLSPFSISVGLMTVALFSWLAAVYLTVELEQRQLRARSREAHEEDEHLTALQHLMRRRAYLAQALLAIFAVSSLIVVGEGVVRSRLLWGSVAPYVHLIVGVSATAALWALSTNRYRIARFFAISQATGIVVGWSVSSLPYLIPERLLIIESAASAETLSATLVCVAIALILVLPSMWALFRVFK